MEGCQVSGNMLERPKFGTFSENRVIGEGLTDDDFFHLTCHIDNNLREKIERGDYVDLDKLIPRDRLSVFDSQNAFADKNKLEWVQKDGNTFLMQAKRASKITSFRKWEQAF